MKQYYNKHTKINLSRLVPYVFSAVCRNGSYLCQGLWETFHPACYLSVIRWRRCTAPAIECMWGSCSVPLRWVKACPASLSTSFSTLHCGPESWRDTQMEVTNSLRIISRFSHNFSNLNQWNTCICSKAMRHGPVLLKTTKIICSCSLIQCITMRHFTS